MILILQKQLLSFEKMVITSCLFFLKIFLQNFHINKLKFQFYHYPIILISL
jgi:hypothetical protein